MIYCIIPTLGKSPYYERALQSVGNLATLPIYGKAGFTNVVNRVFNFHRLGNTYADVLLLNDDAWLALELRDNYNPPFDITGFNLFDADDKPFDCGCSFQDMTKEFASLCAAYESMEGMK